MNIELLQIAIHTSIVKKINARRKQKIIDTRNVKENITCL